MELLQYSNNLSSSGSAFTNSFADKEAHNYDLEDSAVTITSVSQVEKEIDIIHVDTIKNENRSNRIELREQQSTLSSDDLIDVDLQCESQDDILCDSTQSTSLHFSSDEEMLFTDNHAEEIKLLHEMPSMLNEPTDADYISSWGAHSSKLHKSNESDTEFIRGSSCLSKQWGDVRNENLQTSSIFTSLPYLFPNNNKSYDSEISNCNNNNSTSAVIDSIPLQSDIVQDIMNSSFDDSWPINLLSHSYNNAEADDSSNPFYYSLLPEMSNSIPGTNRTFSHDETIIIFDWDDTLFPSTWISRNYTFENTNFLSYEDEDTLYAMAEMSIKSLEIASKLGEVIIVTNAESGWIELSCRRFLPALVPYISNLKIISARSTYSHHNFSDPSLWKKQAFYHEIKTYFDSKPTGKCNVISIGDSTHEMAALIFAREELQKYNLKTKSIKFMERPDIDGLQREHEVIHTYLEELVQYDEVLDIVVKAFNSSPYSIFVPNVEYNLIQWGDNVSSAASDRLINSSSGATASSSSSHNIIQISVE